MTTPTEDRDWKTPQNMEKEIEKFCEKYTLYAGRWHKEDCDFIHADAGVCNCDTAKNRKELKKIVANYLQALTPTT